MAAEMLQRDEAPAEVSHEQGRAPHWVMPVVAGLCVLALALRALIGLRGGLWRDEAQFLFIVDEPSWAAMLNFLRGHESHPPLFYALMRAWLALTGGSDASALALPIAFGGAIVPALYGAGTRLMSWRVGLLAAAAGALSPVLAAHGAMVRPYSLLPLLTLAATYALVRAIDAGGTWRWAGYVAAVLALVYTHNWGWLVLAGHWAAIALCFWRGTSRSRSAVLRGWAGAQAAVAIGFLPWLPTFLAQSAHAGHLPLNVFGGARGPGDVLVDLMVLVRLVLTSTVSPSSGGALVAAAVLWTGSVIVLGGVLHRRARARLGGERPRDRRSVVTVLAVTPVTATGAALLLSLRSDLLLPYCLAMLAPPLLLLVAAGVARLAAPELGRPAVATAMVVVVLGTYAATLPALWQAPRSNARELASQMTTQVAPSDLVVVAPWWLASSFNRYFHVPAGQLDFPAPGGVGAIPFDDEARRLADPVAYAQALQAVQARHAAGERVWFITDWDFTSCAATCLARLSASSEPIDVGTLHLLQLRDQVAQLYGRPIRCINGEVTGARLEQLTACLFEPR